MSTMNGGHPIARPGQQVQRLPVLADADAVRIKRQKVDGTADDRSLLVKAAVDIRHPEHFQNPSNLAYDGYRSVTGSCNDLEQEENSKPALEDTSETSAGVVEPVNTFPCRLMDLLDQGVASEALWWLETGDCFCVVPKLFTKVLDQYFQGTKFESFTRKLNRWGFKRATGQHVPRSSIAFYHTLFQRGERDLLKGLRNGMRHDPKAIDQIDCMDRLGEMHHPPQRHAEASFSRYMTIPSGRTDTSIFGGATSFMLSPSTMTSQFQPQVAANNFELHLQRLLSQQGTADFVERPQSATNLVQLQAQLLASENAELRRLLFARHQPQRISDPLAIQLRLLTSQLNQCNVSTPTLLSTFGSRQPDPSLLQLLLEEERLRHRDF